jgi:hypothetical protein
MAKLSLDSINTARKMKREPKIILFVVIVSFVAIALVVYRYEKLLVDKERDHKVNNKIQGGIAIKTDYTAQEIVSLIKNSAEYLGDSITIFENGDMVSSNGKFNGTLQAVISNDGNMGIVRNNMRSNKLPLQYNIYELAAIYYKRQYPGEVKPVMPGKKDSTIRK